MKGTCRCRLLDTITNKHIHHHTKADKASHKTHKNTITRAFPAVLRTAALPTACCPLSTAGPRIKERWPAPALPSRPAGSPAMPCCPPTTATVASILPPRFALLFPRLINLSAKPFDTLHNMVPVLLGSGSRSFQYGSRISRLVSSPTRVCWGPWDLGWGGVRHLVKEG